MNNLIIGFKKFFTNKNVVTIILVLVALGLLFWGYDSTIKKETNPISVPVAAQTIPPKTRITNDMVTTVEVAGSLVGDNVIRSKQFLVSEESKKYTNINVTIPKGSMFYSDWVVTADKIPGQWIDELDRDKELPYYMSVSTESTLGNAVLPNSYIDFYLKAVDNNGTIMIGRFMKDINVLVVHDSNGNDVFEDNTAIGKPSKIGFAVSKDYYILLTKIEYLNIELIIVPRGTQAPDCKNNSDGNTKCISVTSSTLRDYIDAQTITVEEDAIVEEQTEVKTENTNQEQVAQ